MLDGRVAAFRRRGVELPPPMVVADSWFSDSKLMRHVATTHQGTFLVEGKSTYVFKLPDGRRVKGHDLQQDRDWPWRSSPQVPGVRYARLRATSATYGTVTLIVVSEPREKQFYVMCLDTAISGPRLIRAWKRRHWIEYCFRTLKHLLATGACQGHSEDAYYGHLVLRLMGCFVLFYTSRVICKGRLTMEEIIFSLKHYWRFVDSEPLELKALSQVMDETAASIPEEIRDRRSDPLDGPRQEEIPFPSTTFNIFSVAFHLAHSAPDWRCQTQPCFHSRGVGSVRRTSHPSGSRPRDVSLLRQTSAPG